MITFEFDTKRFNKDLNQMMVVGDLSAAAVVTRAARQIVRNAFRLTPPTGEGGLTQDIGAQRKLGEEAVRRDIAVKAFPLLSKLRIIQENTDAGEWIKTLADRGDFKNASEVMKKIGFKISGIIAKPAERLHKSMRNQRSGRVRRGALPYFVARDGSVEIFVKEKQGEVGKAKGGWLRAFTALRMPMPKWCSKHNSPGHFRGITDKSKPAIEFGNNVPYIQRAGRELRIIENASAYVARQMPKELERYWADIGRGNGNKVKAKLQRDSFEALA